MGAHGRLAFIGESVQPRFCGAPGESEMGTTSTSDMTAGASSSDVKAVSRDQDKTDSRWTTHTCPHMPPSMFLYVMPLEYLPHVCRNDVADFGHRSGTDTTYVGVRHRRWEYICLVANIPQYVVH